MDVLLVLKYNTSIIFYYFSVSYMSLWLLKLQNQEENLIEIKQIVITQGGGVLYPRHAKFQAKRMLLNASCTIWIASCVVNVETWDILQTSKQQSFLHAKMHQKPTKVLFTCMPNGFTTLWYSKYPSYPKPCKCQPAGCHCHYY